MTPKTTTPPPSGFGLSDILFLVFRHKWKLGFGVLLGLVAASVVYFGSQKTYVSQAKVLVRFVADRTSLTPTTAGESVRSTDPRGESILNSEIEIITSRDLADTVADLATPELVLKKLGDHPLSDFLASLRGTPLGAYLPKPANQTNVSSAATHIQRNIKADVIPKSSVILITYEHPDPSVAQKVLEILVQKYLERHLEIHRGSIEALRFLEVQTDALRGQLVQTEIELHRLRTNSGYMDLKAAQIAMAKDMAQIRTLIMEEEANIGAKRAVLPAPTTNAQVSAATNAIETGPVHDANFYKTVCENLDALRAQEIQHLARYRDNHPLVTALRAQISELTKRKEAMEAENPQLALIGFNRTVREGGTSTPDSSLSLPAAEARLKVLIAQHDRIRSDAAQLDSLAGAINDVERRKAVLEENYRAMSVSLEKARIDQTIDASKQTSISVVQAASLASALPGKRAKPAVMTLAACLAIGALLALFSEYVWNPTIKGAGELKRGPLPLMLSIPSLEQAGQRFQRRKGKKGEVVRIDSLPAVSDPLHPMRSYFEALRDRILLEFEGNTKKPKLVGVTACSRGAGASSIAAGMAAAMSETGTGNVLLVDMNFDQGSAHQFFKGKPICALNEAVGEESRETGLVQENLYVASINQVAANGHANNESDANGNENGHAVEKRNGNGNGHGRLVPSKQIAEIMPKLKASDYDFIIFDMPPINPTSTTFRMSGLMDKVLLVVESEETHREDLKQATALLRQAKANASAVLNRQQRLLPRFIPQG